MIDARELAVAAGGRTLIEPCNFSIARGTFTALLGSNGVGKTTLLRTIAGLHRCASGSVTVNGAVLESLEPRARARAIAFLAAEEVFIDRLSVRDVAAMGRYAHHAWWEWHGGERDRMAVEHALDAVGMNAFRDRLFETLSSGERQRVWIALALAQEAQVLLLDEPTSHLDVHSAHAVLALLREQATQGKSVVCALHDLNEAARYADRLLLLGEGRLLAAGSPAAVLTPTLLRRAYGIGMEVVRGADGRPRAFVG